MTYQQAAQLARVRWRQATVRCPEGLNPWTLIAEVQRFYCVEDVTVYDALGEKVLAVSRALTEGAEADDPLRYLRTSPTDPFCNLRTNSTDFSD